MLDAEVKAKINNLRVYYSRELAKEKSAKKSGAGSEEVYQSKWPRFKSLEFLRDVIAPRKVQSNIVCIIKVLHIIILPSYLSIRVKVITIFISNLLCILCIKIGALFPIDCKQPSSLQFPLITVPSLFTLSNDPGGV